MKYVLRCFSCVRLFATPWTVAHQAPLPMEFSRQEYWSMLSYPAPRDLHNPGMKPVSLVSPAVAGRFLNISTTWEAIKWTWSRSVVSNSLQPMDCSLPGSSVHGIFPGKEYLTGLLLPPPGDLPDPGIQCMSSASPALVGGFSTAEPSGKPLCNYIYFVFILHSILLHEYGYFWLTWIEDIF